MAGLRLRRLKPVQLLVYVLFRTAVATVCMFPPHWARRIGRFIGRLFHMIDVRRRAVTRRNLTHAGMMPKDSRAQSRLVRRVFENLGISAAENLMLPRMIGSPTFLEHTRFEDLDIVDRVIAQGRGTIVTIAHLGNWEWIGLSVCMRGYALRSIARPIDNPYVERWLSGFRTLTGQRIIVKFGAMRAMVDVLKRNEILVILADQDARESGVMAPFFGHPAMTVKSPALLSLRYGSPIVPVNIWRDDAGLHHVKITPPLATPQGVSHDDAVRLLSTALNARFEEFIREHPAQWMWVHPRWKHAQRAERQGTAKEPELSTSPE